MTDDKTSPLRTALSVSVVLVCLGAWDLYRRRFIAAYCFGGAGTALCLIGVFLPAWARRFHHAWMWLAKGLGAVNSRILLTAMHYLVLTPVGLFLRLVKHDPLQLRAHPAQSYWVMRAETRQPRDRFERLF